MKSPGGAVTFVILVVDRIPIRLAQGPVSVLDLLNGPSFYSLFLGAADAPDGSVKLIESVGGNPLLIKAAQEAVTKWRYAPALHETRELIELRFNVQ
jgi:hypothetical protein